MGRVKAHSLRLGEAAESLDRIGSAQHRPISRIELEKCQQGIEVFLNDLHRRRKQPPPLLLQSEESCPRRTLGGSIKDRVEIFGEQFTLLFANPPASVGLGMFLAALR